MARPELYARAGAGTRCILKNVMLTALFLLIPSFAHARPPARPALVAWSIYRGWTPSKRIAYVREARRALGQFQAPRQMVMDECLVGGVVRDLVPGSDVCPTTDNSCEPLDDGFTCGLVYDAVCVERTPVATLTARCESGSKDRTLTQTEFEERSEGFLDVLERCEAARFGRRNAHNCEVFRARLTYLNARYTGADEVRATAAVAATVAAANVPAIPSPPATPVCRGEPYQVFQDGGGVVSTYVDRAQALNDSGRKVEIRGVCASACLLLVAAVPHARVCVAPGARLGFHQARDRVTGQVDHAFTAYTVAKYYSPELKALWANHYSATTELNVVNYAELTGYYATCDTPADVCSANAVSTTPATTPPAAEATF